jgi:hypothetical protein
LKILEEINPESLSAEIKAARDLHAETVENAL